MIRTDLSEQDVVNNMLELAVYLVRQENGANALDITMEGTGSGLNMHFEVYTEKKVR